MKSTFLIIIFSILCIPLFSQNEKVDLPISVGLYGAYIIQPGLKIGTTFTFKEWNKEKNYIIKQSSLFVSPQMGVFMRPKNHISYVINADVGYKMNRTIKRFYVAPSLGLGYLLENRTLSTTIDLGSGDIIGKDKELIHYFLPTINFEFGQEGKNKVGWYSKLSYGRKISQQLEDSGFFALEIGIKINLEHKE